MFKLAIAAGYYRGKDPPNPAAWKGHLEYILRASKDIHATRSFPSLPYQDVGRFMAKLRVSHDPPRTQSSARDSERKWGHTTSAFLLEFIILTAARVNEVRHATWEEIDLPNRVWKVPWEHRKNRRYVPKGQAHFVPITPPMLEVLEEMQRRRTDHSDNAPVFPSPRGGHYLQNYTVWVLITKLWKEKVPNPDGSVSTITVHGFRTTFHQWAINHGHGGQDGYGRLIDLQLDHKIGGSKIGGLSPAYPRPAATNENGGGEPDECARRVRDFMLPMPPPPVARPGH
jgi:integrase